MADIFLSYAHEDEARIQPLVRVLEERGWSVFWDMHIPAGQSWLNCIDQAINEARCMIVAWSRHSVASNWVKEEAEEGRKRGILIPVLLDCIESPLGFRLIQTADLTDWQAERLSPRVEQLLRDIETLLHSPRVPIERKEFNAHLKPEPQAALGASTDQKPSIRRIGWPHVLAGVAMPFLLVIIWTLGAASLHAREALLGVESLQYPQQRILLVGVEALGSLIWNGLAATVSSHATLHGSSIVCLGLLFCLATIKHLRPFRAFATFSLLFLVLVTLTVGAGFYSIALRATNLSTTGPLEGLYCGGRPTSNLADIIAFESCSWLTNDSPRNDERRQSLAGLLLWLILVCAAAARTSSQLRGSSTPMLWLSRSFVGAYLLLALFYLRFLPLSYAYTTWGLRYPPVKASLDCTDRLAHAIAAGYCCAFDISAGSYGTALLLRGTGCPEGSGVVLLSTDRLDLAHCLVRQADTKVIFNGCG